MQTSKKFLSWTFRPNHFSSMRYNSKTQMRGVKYTFVFSGLCYLYFQEDILNKLITEVQGRYYGYQGLLEENRKNFEINKQRKLLDKLFEPDLRITYLNEKISRQLNALEPFEGDFLSLFVEDKLQQLKDNGAQTYIAQRGGGKTMESLKIAKAWKEKEGPVLFFDGSDYERSYRQKIFEKYEIDDINNLKKVLRGENSAKTTEFNLQKYIQQLNKKIMLPLFAATHNQTQTQETTPNKSASTLKQEETQRKPLLIIVDDADDLRPHKEEDNAREQLNAKKEFVLHLKELVKEGYAKALFLCRDYETQSWLKEEFDSGLWKGIYGGSPDLKEKTVVQKYVNFVSELTGARPNEAEKFFDFFGVDFNSVVDLKNYIQKQRISQHIDSKNIHMSEFIQSKVKESEQELKNNEKGSSIMKICKNIDKDWRKSKLSPREREKIEEIMGPDGWTSLKYKAAAYSICGKPFKY